MNHGKNLLVVCESVFQDQKGCRKTKKRRKEKKERVTFESERYRSTSENTSMSNPFCVI